MVPLPVYSQSPIGAVVFVIEKETMENVMVQADTAFKGATYILDASKNPIFHYDSIHINDGGHRIEEEFQQLVVGHQQWKISDNNYSVVAVQSEQTGWYYVDIIPTHYFLSKVNQQIVYVVVLTVVMLLLCVTIAVYLTINNYRPIKKLNLSVQDFLPDNKQSNEIDQIKDAITNVVSMNTVLQKKMDDQQYMLGQSLLLHLFSGNRGSEEDWKNYMSGLKRNASELQFTVVTVRYDRHDEEVAQLNGRLLELIMHKYSFNRSAYGVECGDGNMISILVQSGLNGMITSPASVATYVSDFYEPHFKQRVHIGLGKTYTELTHVKLSWIESIAAAEQHAVPNSTIIDFDQIQFPMQVDTDFMQDQLHLYHSLKQGNTQLVGDVLERIGKDMLVNNQGGLHYKYIYFKIVDLAIKVINDLELMNHAQFERRTFNDQIVRVLNANTFHECEQAAQKLLNFICIVIARLQQDRDTDLTSKVLAYVTDNFQDQGMGLEKLSERFGNSNYFWSRFFKERLQFHFSDYLWKLRIEEAKRLLREEDYTIKDVVSRIGYLDHASFMRKFKQEEGITPGQYRKLNTNKSKNANNIEELTDS